MRTLELQHVTQEVRRLVQSINVHTAEPTMARLVQILEREPSPSGREAMRQIVANRQIASARQVPMCQDTGMVVVFAEVGQDLRLSGQVEPGRARRDAPGAAAERASGPAGGLRDV